MNLFTLHTDPLKAATAHYDLHVKKMILEVAQILDGGTRPILTNLKPSGGPYEIVKIPHTHRDNPVIHSARTKWVWEWSYDHLRGLLSEYFRRWGTEHVYAKNGLLPALQRRYDVVEKHLQSGPGLFMAMDQGTLDATVKSRLHGRRDRYAPDLATAVAAHRANYALTKLTYGKRNLPSEWTKHAPPIWLRTMARSHGYVMFATGDGRRYFFEKRHYD